MTSSVQEARQALGQRLREIRRRAGISGRELARLEGWHESKVSKYEFGKLHASDAVIQAYCRHCGAADQLEDLLATLHHIDSAYVEWKRLLGPGIKAGQQRLQKLEAEATFIRNYQPVIVTGLLQTPEYAEAMLRYVGEFYQLPGDIEQAVAARMRRQQVLYQRDKRFHFVVGEQALYTTVGDDQVMIGQLDRLLTAGSLPRVTFGIVPKAAEARVLFNNFVLYDNRLAAEEGSTAKLTITQPRELALYLRAFDTLAGQSVTGEKARELIRRALDDRTRI
ncbi:Helix-turn-helix domain-containing protein [Nocardia amikacinitolerans]|uniref:helix-turn-helix domain-containing protein n=1 Tax=Nocardia amikacinitolerans TaxID=756689 RepID=UPI00082FE5EB|nr:helix-turn-helix transcriptional regulator [Nocardia amikacinitolerans]MCP2321023.1 Helix-turn-helix domain-containing protein [Nocardia amikacinitolerans]